MFGLGALLVSTSLGGLSYFTTRHFLLSERESASIHQAYVNASLVRNSLDSGNNQFNQMLASLDVGSNSHSVLFYKSSPYSSSLSVGANAIPSSLRIEVSKDNSAFGYYIIAGVPQMVVGVPIPAEHSMYFEVFDLSDLYHTLRVLALTLIAAGLLTTVIGAAVGRWASGRSLRPLTSVSHAAVAIASGEVETRLAGGSSDPDLAGLTESFNTMIDQLQARIEREARFTSDVSHELRSPLTTLAASLEVLESHGSELSGPSSRALKLFGEDLRRFQRMVDDLLEISKTDSGSADIFLEEVNVRDLIHYAVAGGTRALSNTQTQNLPIIHVDPSVNDTHIDVDKRRFERVIVNLMENAAHYAGGVTNVIVEATGGTSLGPAQSKVRITIQDKGPGIPESEREKIFERFYRGGASGRRGTGTGTGLGLALVSEHIRIMGGEVWVEDSPGGGAQFIIELPVSDGKAQW